MFTFRSTKRNLKKFVRIAAALKDSGYRKCITVLPGIQPAPAEDSVV